MNTPTEESSTGLQETLQRRRNLLYLIGVSCFIVTILWAPSVLQLPVSSSIKEKVASASHLSCQEKNETKPTSSLYKSLEETFPVKVPKTGIKDWDAVSCANILPSCDLKNHTWGVPLLVVSFGRGGSSSTWTIIAGLTGEFSPRPTEDTGSDNSQAEKFFASQNQTEHGKCWLERLLCEKQREVQQAFEHNLGRAGVFGSKWKPWHENLNGRQAREALEWLGTQKYIKVVHSTRSMLDQYISQHKHTVLDDLFGDERAAHCQKSHEKKWSNKAYETLEAMGISRDTPCDQIYKEIEKQMTLDIPGLMGSLEKNAWRHDFVREMLDYYNVSRVSVTYEKLYLTDNAEEWMKIFRYLGFGPQQNLTLDHALAASDLQKTSSNDKSKRMANYDEVAEALRCTRYAKYLD